MALTLLIHIPDLPRFDDATAARWSLLDAGASPLRQGESVLAEAPRADRVVAVAPVNHLVFIETPLPAVAPAKRNALLRYAIEDKLTIDPATVHALVLGKALSGDHLIAAIDRGWLAGALAWLTRAKHAPQALVSSAAAVAVAPGEWSVAVDGAHAFARRADGFVHSFDVDAAREPPFALGLALAEARAHGQAPTALALHGIDAAAAERWSRVFELPVRIAAAPANPAAALLAAARNTNLLTGEFAPAEAGAAWRAALVPAAFLAAAILLAHLGFVLAENWRLDRERAAREQAMNDVFREAFPGAMAIVDAPLQMRRNLDRLKAERGIASEDDARARIAALSQIVQALPEGSVAIVALSVREGAATLDLTVRDAAAQATRTALERALARVPGARLETREAGAARITIGGRA